MESNASVDELDGLPGAHTFDNNTEGLCEYKGDGSWWWLGYVCFFIFTSLINTDIWKMIFCKLSWGLKLNNVCTVVLWHSHGQGTRIPSNLWISWVMVWLPTSTHVCDDTHGWSYKKGTVFLKYLAAASAVLWATSHSVMISYAQNEPQTNSLHYSGVQYTLFLFYEKWLCSTSEIAPCPAFLSGTGNILFVILNHSLVNSLWQPQLLKEIKMLWAARVLWWCQCNRITKCTD